MADFRRYLPPEVVARLGRLEIRARAIVEGFLAGRHRSPYFGQSVEFVQHRQYTWGDDWRHVDWKVWARQDRLYVKQFEEETNLRTTLLLDRSASMSYDARGTSKFDVAATLAACIAYFVLRQQDAVGLVTFDQVIRTRVPQRTQFRHLDSLLSALEQTEPKDKTGFLPIAQELVQLYPQRGLVIVLSDLFIDIGQIDAGLKCLRSHGHDVMVFHVLHDDELDFPFHGPIRFEGLEVPRHLRCNPEAFREGYLQSLQQFLHGLRQACAASDVDYLLVRTSEPPDRALLAFLTKRSLARRWRRVGRKI